MKYGTKRLLKAISISMALLLMFTVPAGSMIAHAAGGSDNIAPNAPARLAAISVGQTSLKLAWSRSADNVGTTSYAVYQNYAYSTYCTTNYCTITGLMPGTSYVFYVAAQDGAGNLSGRSNVITATTLTASGEAPANGPSPTIAPAPVTSPAATAAPASTPAPAATTPVASPSGKVIAGYYASWAAYQGYTPSDIPAANLTHIIYAFANISSSYKIAVGDPEVDPGNFAELKALKAKYPKLRTLISVGGWEWSDKFSDMAATSSGRTGFADSVVAFLRKYGLDGVDLDWEYPVGGGEAGNSARAADKTNFTALLKLLREKLTAAGKADGKKYLLTIAGGADTNYIGHVQLKSIAPYLDFATVMTYDMHGAFDRYTDHNAPLYAAQGTSPQTEWSADQAVKAWVASGFPKSKLVMGVPFYGHLYSNVQGGGTGIYKLYSGMKTVSYDQVVSGYLSNSAYTRYYGAQGRTPWLFNGSTFISYEDTKSLGEKAGYINSQGLAGAGIWELSQNMTGVLLRTLRTNLK